VRVVFRSCADPDPADGNKYSRDKPMTMHACRFALVVQSKSLLLEKDLHVEN